MSEELKNPTPLVFSTYVSTELGKCMSGLTILVSARRKKHDLLVGYAKYVTVRPEHVGMTEEEFLATEEAAALKDEAAADLKAKIVELLAGVA